MKTIRDNEPVVRLELDLDGLEYLVSELPTDDGFTKQLAKILAEVLAEGDIHA